MDCIWRGERLKAQREMIGLTTEELANRIGTSHSHISIWEKNKSEPRGSYLMALGKALKIKPETLYEWHIDLSGQNNANILTLNPTA